MSGTASNRDGARPRLALPDKPEQGSRPIGVKLRRILTLRSGPEGRVSIRAK